MPLFQWSLSPLWHYLFDKTILSNLLFKNPERFMTIMGLALSVVGILMAMFDEWGSSIIFCGVILPSLLISPYASLLLTRSNPKDFVEAMSAGETSSSALIKHASYEAHRVVDFVSRYDGEDINFAIQRMRDSIRIIESLKPVLAVRLKVSVTELSDDFLKFNHNIFENRCTKLADLTNASLKNDPRYAETIKFYLSNIKEHLYSLSYTKIDLDQFSMIFQSRSISGATQLLIKFIQNEIIKGNISSIVDLQLINELQKAHRTGTEGQKAIGIAISTYIRENNKNSVNREVLISRVKCLSERFLFDELKKDNESTECLLNSFDNWHFEVNKQIGIQRNEISNEFSPILKELYADHMNKRKGRFYVVISAYSRAVRTILKSVIGDSYYKDIYVVICEEDVTAGSYSSRLMYQQILEEFWASNIDACKSESLYWKTWRSSFQQLESRLVSGKDSVVYLCGCDQIDIVNGSNGVKCLAAFKYSPISTLEALSETKEIKINALVVAGEYKLNSTLLANMLEPELRTKVTELIPKQRRSSLFQWVSTNKVEVKIISSYIVSKTVDLLDLNIMTES